jgi:hypothetical protein
MRYLCLGYYAPDKFDQMSAAEGAALADKCRRYDEELRNSGHLLSVASLEHRRAVTIRPRDGRPAVHDGPFAEAKEVVGAFFLIEAKDLDEAIRVASLHPAANYGEDLGWGIEVRPIGRFDQL